MVFNMFCWVKSDPSPEKKIRNFPHFLFVIWIISLFPSTPMLNVNFNKLNSLCCAFFVVLPLGNKWKFSSVLSEKLMKNFLLFIIKKFSFVFSFDIFQDFLSDFWKWAIFVASKRPFSHHHSPTQPPPLSTTQQCSSRVFESSLLLTLSHTLTHTT